MKECHEVGWGRTSASSHVSITLPMGSGITCHKRRISRRSDKRPGAENTGLISGHSVTSQGIDSRLIRQPAVHSWQVQSDHTQLEQNMPTAQGSHVTSQVVEPHLKLLLLEPHLKPLLLAPTSGERDSYTACTLNCETRVLHVP